MGHKFVHNCAFKQIPEIDAKAFRKVHSEILRSQLKSTGDRGYIFKLSASLLVTGRSREISQSLRKKKMQTSTSLEHYCEQFQLMDSVVFICINNSNEVETS